MSEFEERHPVQSEVSHEVVEDEPVQLWKDGVFITTSSRNIAEMLQQGWLTGSPDDLPALLGEIKLMAEQVVSNIEQFIAGVTADGYIDPADGGVYAASLTARHLLDEKIAALLGVVHSAYPMRQGEPASIVHQGETHYYDPAQVPVLDPEGGLRFIDPAEETRLAQLGWKKV